MSSLSLKTLLAAFVGPSLVAAHGHVKNIVVNGLSYQAFDPSTFPYMQNPPKVAGWTAANTDNGFVGPESFAAGDIICHKSATNAGGHAVVAAGDKVFIQWDTWPESHKGPVIDYLANCGVAGCETVDKTALQFFKIDEVGLVDGTTAPGTWGSDQLIKNNNSWLVEIPPTIAPGFYVLRHEIIALHSAGQANGAQNYPQCFNLQVTGGGSVAPAGVKGMALYTATDPGILVNIYTPLASYKIPGPALIGGAVKIAQGSSAITASATAITSSAAASPVVATTTAVKPTTSSSTSSSAAAVAPTTAASVLATTKPATTAVPQTTAAAVPAATTKPATTSSSSTSSKPSTLSTSTKATAKVRVHPRDIAAS
ncbi:glycosyl hydrolase family 61-domain-containing protein [Lasiosphaeria miniovina]|uniref:lytic cellulose monooxygenase (C4-dehydrogenating) n=1 Tax=Lasiosphaeria miniovina TaxID=1954250 RepID=A0AA40A5I6_9PEZI|nr:glycosyl hydrolase family 61-domain-containing protein [Lasiosphaeria miniovina]KAK0709652.1 glycosyl hydrolase family 61-domain-containing protein [Lasiosphaeria miniovina]